MAFWPFAESLSEIQSSSSTYLGGEDQALPSNLTSLL